MIITTKDLGKKRVNRKKSLGVVSTSNTDISLEVHIKDKKKKGKK